MKMTRSDFGQTESGETIHIYHMKNEHDACVDIIDYGCRVVRLVVPNREGILTDVCLGADTAEDYCKDVYSLGAVVGRFANRIKNGRFVLDGTTYQLATNNGTNHLHGGVVGFASKLWEADMQEDCLILTMHSPDGEEGYPGNLTLTVTYRWSDDNELSILYEASSDRDTPLNVANHCYFNLNGEDQGDVLSHELLIDADAFTELDDTQVPTGRLLDVSGTPFDFRSMHTIGKYMGADYAQFSKFGTYDHNFVLNGSGFREFAILQSAKSGIRMTCFTDQPGMQLFVAGEPLPIRGKGGRTYEPFTSCCLETQHFPDAVNHDNFPSAILHAGTQFRSKTMYHFSVF